MGNCILSKKYVEYYNSGMIKSKKWSTCGVLDRRNKPANIEYHENGNFSIEEWYCKGVLHNDGNPARIKYFKNGNVQSKEWIVNGKNHRDNGPAHIEYYENKNIDNQRWYFLGQNKNFGDNPSYLAFYENGFPKLEIWAGETVGYSKRNINEANVIGYYDNGSIFSRQWETRNGIQNGVIYRENGPAYMEYYDNGNILRHQYTDKKGLTVCSIEWYNNGNIRTQEWHKNGKLHRANDLPARIEFFENGKIKSKEWRVLGVLYREKGSAYIEYSLNRVKRVSGSKRK